MESRKLYISDLHLFNEKVTKVGIIDHPCYNCPQINEELSRRLNIIERLYKDGLSDLDDIIVEESIGGCYCDKLGGGKIRWVNINGCEDYCKSINRKKIRKSNKRKRNKRERDLKYKNHLKALYKDLGDKCLCPVVYTEDYYWDRKDSNKSYYKRIYWNHGGSLKKFYKKQSNRKLRRYDDCVQRGDYKKLYDYWWQLY